MTEAGLTTEATKTALAEVLARGEGGGLPQIGPELRLELVSYRGSLTPLRLDAPERETAAMLFGAAVHDLGWLRRIAVRGEDRFRWLSGMVTNNVESLADRSGAYNLVLNAQGRIQGDCYIWRNGDELEIEVTADQAEALLAHFDKFIIMDDVELVPIERRSSIGLAGPLTGEIVAKLGFPPLGNELVSFDGVTGIETGVQDSGIPVRICRTFGSVVPHYSLSAAVQDVPALWRAILALGATPMGVEAIETLRVVEGIPVYGVDIQSRDLAQETSQHRALSFTKGCYLGQEIVERIRSRGQVHRHLRSLELFPNSQNSAEVPAAGTELKVAGMDAKAAASLTSVTAIEVNGKRRIFAIAMVRAEAEVGTRDLVYEGGTARILNATPRFD